MDLEKIVKKNRTCSLAKICYPEFETRISGIGKVYLKMNKLYRILSMKKFNLYVYCKILKDLFAFNVYSVYLCPNNIY